MYNIKKCSYYSLNDSKLSLNFVVVIILCIHICFFPINKKSSLNSRNLSKTTSGITLNFLYCCNKLKFCTLKFITGASSVIIFGNCFL